MKTMKITALILCVAVLASLFCACESGKPAGTDTLEPDVESTMDKTNEPSGEADEDTSLTGTVGEQTGSENADTVDARDNTDESSNRPTTGEQPERTADNNASVSNTKNEMARYLVFKKVYGTGTNNDTPIKYGFIELYNCAESKLDLSGLTLHVYSKRTKTAAKTNLPAVKMAPASSYLIRCAEAVDEKGNAFNGETEKLIVDNYDYEWNVVLDNKEIVLAITDKDYNFDPSKLATDGNVYNYFIGTQTATSDVHAAVGITKNIAACKAEPNSKYELFNYKTAAPAEILDHSPVCQKGDVNNTLSAAVNVVQFSKEAGIYDKEFDLKLSALNGYKIYYTTDGSDPRTSGIIYSGSIKIADTSAEKWGRLTKLTNTLMGMDLPTQSTQIGAKVIKAYASNGKTKTQVTTKTYFVVPGMKDYDTLAVSLSLNPDDFLSRKNGMYNLQMNDPFGTKLRRTAFLEMFETDGSRVSASYVEIALNGNGSLGFNAKSIRAYFKSTAAPDVVGNPSKLKYDIFRGDARDGVTEYKRIIFRNAGNDSSVAHIRDAYLQRLCSALNCPTMAYRPTLMFINGEFWGVYNARERYDAKYFESHYGIPEDDLVMLESVTPLATGSWDTPYELNEGEKGDEKPFHQLVKYIEGSDLSDNEKFKYVSDRIDIDNMIDFFVGSMYLGNNDWPGNNIKVWRNKNENNGLDTKWRFVFCDMDMGAGLNTNINTNMFTHTINDNTVAGRIFKRMLRNKSFKQKFIDRFYECAETVFNTSRALPILEEMYHTVKDIMPLHFVRWPGDGGSVSRFKSQVTSLTDSQSIRYFMIYRESKAIAHMEAFFNIKK